jgi:hypothetical protein
MAGAMGRRRLLDSIQIVPRQEYFYWYLLEVMHYTCIQCSQISCSRPIRTEIKFSGCF